MRRSLVWSIPLVFMAGLSPVTVAGVSPAWGQEVELVTELTAPDTVEVEEHFAHRFTVLNIGSATPWEVEFVLRMTGTKAIQFGGLRQRRTRYENECEVVSREKPVVAQCTFERRHLTPGRKIWVEIYTWPNGAPQRVRTSVLRYRYREQRGGDWVEPESAPPEGPPADAVTVVVPRGPWAEGT